MWRGEECLILLALVQFAGQLSPSAQLFFGPNYRGSLPRSSRNSHRQTCECLFFRSGVALGDQRSGIGDRGPGTGDLRSEMSATPTTTAGRINIPSWPLLFAYICMQICIHTVSTIYTLEHLKCWITVVVSFFLFSLRWLFVFITIL